MTKSYPYQAWVLTPSFKPKEVKIVCAYESLQYADTWDVAEGGKLYSVANELFPSKDAAIDAGWDRIRDQEAKLAKMQESIYKRRAQLAKAMGA